MTQQKPFKAFWSVYAQLIPGMSMPEEPVKRWRYSVEDYEADGGTLAGRNAAGSRWRELQLQAHDFVVELQDRGLNFVTCEYIWL